ncbi:MAG: phosphatase PAP2 family protein [Anaerolineae bacterium]|nr:phosphatase PAP2 family protein [Anaerolineae bacterium]
MDPIYEFGLNMTRYLQETFPQLEGFFVFISTLGLEEFYLSLFPLIYWCIHKTVGKLFAYVFLIASALNPLFKFGFRGPRPFWFDPSLEMWEETSYGVPSGHVQLATVTYLFIAGWIRRWWAWVIAFVMIFLMGISRIYLGSHFPHDVVVGFVISVLLLLGVVAWRRTYAKGFEKRILGQKLMAAITIPVVYAMIFAVVSLLIGKPDMTVSWALYIPAAELAAWEGAATAVGMLLGAGIGLIFEGSRIRFRADGSIGLRVVRYLVGMGVTILLWAGLKAIFPEDPLWLAMVLRVLRYFLVALWITYYAPWVFVKTKLAQADPDPGIDLKIPRS